MKTYHYYIDEAGGIENNSDYFILGCYKTDTPDSIRESINQLKLEITNSPYFAFERLKFVKEGFHACKNHFDIKARFYNLISTLNIRAYVLIINKHSEFFKKMISDNKKSEIIYHMLIEKLLKDRLIKHRFDHNILIFEQYGSKPEKWKKNIEGIIEKITISIKDSFQTNLSYEVSVHTKDDVNISIIDYINYLFIQFYENKKVEERILQKDRMLQNFKIIEPKIGLIYKMDKDEFYSNKNRININEY